MSGTTVVFRTFRGVAAGEDAVVHRKARLLRGEVAAVDVGIRTLRRTVQRRIFSVPIGTSALPRHLQGCPTDAKSSSQRRSKDSSGQSTRIRDKYSGSRTSHAKSTAAAERPSLVVPSIVNGHTSG